MGETRPPDARSRSVSEIHGLAAYPYGEASYAKRLVGTASRREEKTAFGVSRHLLQRGEPSNHRPWCFPLGDVLIVGSLRSDNSGQPVAPLLYKTKAKEEDHANSP